MPRKVPWLTSHRLCFRGESLMIDCVYCLYLVLMCRFNVTKLFALDCLRNVCSVLEMCFFLCVFFMFFCVGVYVRLKTILGAQQVKTCKLMLGYDVI